jgi:hypothetical protein
MGAGHAEESADREGQIRYRVVGIRRDGTREVRSSNLFKATAEAVQVALLAEHRYKRVVVEREPEPSGEPPD